MKIDIIDIYNTLEKEFGSQDWWPTFSSNKPLEILIGLSLPKTHLGLM